MNLHDLTRSAGPGWHGLVCPADDLSNAVRQLDAAPHVAARLVRGPKARTVAALYDEMAAALQFPLYFGENWDALHDCLGDLAWLGTGPVVVVVAEAEHLLEGAAPAEQKRLGAVFDSAIQNRRAAGQPLHVVLHTLPGRKSALEARCRALGLTPAWLT